MIEIKLLNNQELLKLNYLNKRILYFSNGNKCLTYIFVCITKYLII